MMPFSSNVDGCEIWQYSYFGHNVYFRPHNEVIVGECTREIQILPYMHIVSMTFYHDMSVKIVLWVNNASLAHIHYSLPAC